MYIYSIIGVMDDICQDLCLLEETETERGCLDSVGSRIIVT